MDRQGEIEDLHGNGGLFAFAAALLGADGVQSEMSRGVVKPAAHNLGRAERFGLLSEGGEHALGHILGQVGIAHQTPRGGIDHRQMAVDELPERVLRAALDVFTQ